MLIFKTLGISKIEHPALENQKKYQRNLFGKKEILS